MSFLPDNSLRTRTWSDHLNNPNILKGKFSSLEREIIDKTVRDYLKSQNWTWDEGIENIFCAKKGKKDRHWPIIGESLPNRSLQSIYYCAKRMLCFGKKGKWSKEEENELIRLVNEHGQRWSMFTEFIGRSAASIRDKWRDLSTRIHEQSSTDGAALTLPKNDFERPLKSRMPLVIDVFVLYCIEYYTGKFLPYKGISWKTIVDSFSLPLFPSEFLRFWAKCCKYLKKKQGIELIPISDNDLSCYSGKINQAQIRLRYISSLYPKLKSIQEKRIDSLISETFLNAIKYLYETRFSYSNIDEIKYNDWPKVLSVHIPLTTLWSRIRLALCRMTSKEMHISDRILILYEKLQSKSMFSSKIPSAKSHPTLEEDEVKKGHFQVDKKRLRKIIAKLIKRHSKKERKKTKSSAKSRIEYSSLQQVIQARQSA